MDDKLINLINLTIITITKTPTHTHTHTPKIGALALTQRSYSRNPKPSIRNLKSRLRIRIMMKDISRGAVTNSLPLPVHRAPVGIGRHEAHGAHSHSKMLHIPSMLRLLAMSCIDTDPDSLPFIFAFYLANSLPPCLCLLFQYGPWPYITTMVLFFV
jgi:hypothetical protein